MGLFKKKDGDAADDDRSRLFGSRKNKAAPPAQNPYATQPAGDPYSNQAPPAYSGSGDSFRQEKSPAVTSQGQRYGGGGSYGQQGGYGSDRFGGGGQQPPVRQGGYGGLGPADDSDRSALFGAAPQRYQENQRGPQSGNNSYGGYGQSGAYGESGAYGNGPRYDDRQLTEEEQAEEDADAMKGEIKFIKQQDVSSTRNALRLGRMAEEIGSASLARLGAQREQMYNAEHKMDLASSQSKVALENGKTLETAAHMFHAPKLGSSKAREAARQQKALETHQTERAEREAVRKAAWEANARQDGFQRNLQGVGAAGTGRSTLADRAKFQFEADSDDENMENEIEDNLQELHNVAKRLNYIARATGEEVDGQNQHIDRLTGKADHLDDQVKRGRNQLERVAARN